MGANSGTDPDREPLVDREHLDAQTFGDRGLARELLGLFEEQCRRLVPGISDAGLARGERADLAHTLKGSALGVGTMRVAARASETEEALRAGHPAADQVRTLSRAVEDTLAHLAAAD